MLYIYYYFKKKINPDHSGDEEYVIMKNCEKVMFFKYHFGRAKREIVGLPSSRLLNVTAPILPNFGKYVQRLDKSGKLGFARYTLES